MKKLLFILSLVASVCICHAQSGYAYVFPTQAGDTLTNTDTVSRLIPATSGYSALGVQVSVNKLSGTLAGKAYLFSSTDGKNFALTDSAVYVSTPTITSTAYYNGPITPTYTNVAQFTKNTVPFVYYLVQAVSSGTVSAPVQFSYTARYYISPYNR